MRVGLTSLLTVGVAHATPAAQSAQPRKIVGHVLKPTQAPPPAVNALKVAEGFRVRRFAENLGKPRMPAHQGRSSRGNTGYVGPRPPKEDPPHHYHFQVFALDASVTLDPDVSREQLLTAMTGHAVAGGETVGMFAASPSPE
jgi:Phosphatidylethanolamine-binding protein